MNVREALKYAKTPEGIKAARALMDKPRLIENRLTLLYARMDELRDQMDAGCQYLDGMPRASGHGDKTAKIAVRLCDLERETEHLLHDLAVAQRQLKRILQDLPEGDGKQALEMIYLDSLSPNAAADRLYLEQRQFFRRLNKGLEQVAMRIAMDLTCESGKSMV